MAGRSPEPEARELDPNVGSVLRRFIFDLRIIVACKVSETQASQGRDDVRRERDRVAARRVGRACEMGAEDCATG